MHLNPNVQQNQDSQLNFKQSDKKSRCGFDLDTTSAFCSSEPIKKAVSRQTDGGQRATVAYAVTHCHSTTVRDIKQLASLALSKYFSDVDNGDAHLAIYRVCVDMIESGCSR